MNQSIVKDQNIPIVIDIKMTLLKKHLKQLIKDFAKYCPEYKNVKWIADISDYIVKGVIIGSPLSGECGAYPDHIPENMNI